MAQEFSLYEVKQIAVNLEKDGLAFYKAMAKRAENSRARAIFLKLASDEEEHIRWIEDHIKVEDIFQEQLMDATKAADDYIREIVKSGVFPNPEKAPEVMQQIQKDEDGVRIAMEAERKSTRFYDILAREARESETKSALLRLKDQEIEHYRLLDEFLQEITK